MHLIQRVRIQGFRSLQNVELPELGGLTALVGRNSSGKSNILRALNLFFNGEVEPNKRLDFRRDHYAQTPRLRQKKRIRIEVRFALPANFKFRPPVLEGLGREFSVARIWELDQQRVPISRFEAPGSEVEGAESLAEQFLRQITFRYIPNRAVPADLLKAEGAAIAKSLTSRVRSDEHASAVIRDVSDAAGRFLSRAGDSMESAGSPITSPTLATGSSLADLLSVTGFHGQGAHGHLLADEDWGAGHQAFFLYQVLFSIDTNYGLHFGWKQATIWGVEEPESALHKDLETRLAHAFRTWALEPRAKLQIIGTTHSSTFSMAAEQGYWLELKGPQTILEHLPIPQLTRASEQQGVSDWIHPALAFPWNPVVLVEGKTDQRVLSHVASLTGATGIRFVTLPSLDTREQGHGKDAIKKFLRMNSSVIANRTREAPLLVLLDWEVSDNEIAQVQSAYGIAGDRRVRRADPSHCHELMGTSFKGIERFYPPQVVREIADRGDIRVGIVEGQPYSIAANELNRKKHLLANQVLETDDPEALPALAAVVKNLEQQIRGDRQLSLGETTGSLPPNSPI